ncbi:MAG: hypothetical protein ABL898_11920 [Hyphomicrobiaceae bacterium]
MKRIILAVATATTLIATAGFANAESRSYWNNDGSGERREARQESAIEQGRRNGSITGSEYRSLQAEQARIDALQNRAKADGRVDRREAAQIAQAQNNAARHIAQESNDRERRGSWFRRWW